MPITRRMIMRAREYDDKKNRPRDFSHVWVPTNSYNDDLTPLSHCILCRQWNNDPEVDKSHCMVAESRGGI